jgi:hypothetical protein
VGAPLPRLPLALAAVGAAVRLAVSAWFLVVGFEPAGDVLYVVVLADVVLLGTAAMILARRTDVKGVGGLAVGAALLLVVSTATDASVYLAYKTDHLPLALRIRELSGESLDLVTALGLALLVGAVVVAARSAGLRLPRALAVGGIAVAAWSILDWAGVCGLIAHSLTGVTYADRIGLRIAGLVFPVYAVALFSYVLYRSKPDRQTWGAPGAPYRAAAAPPETAASPRRDLRPDAARALSLYGHAFVARAGLLLFRFLFVVLPRPLQTDNRLAAVLATSGAMLTLLTLLGAYRYAASLRHALARGLAFASLYAALVSFAYDLIVVRRWLQWFFLSDAWRLDVPADRIPLLVAALPALLLLESFVRLARKLPNAPSAFEVRATQSAIAVVVALFAFAVDAQDTPSDGALLLMAAAFVLVGFYGRLVSRVADGLRDAVALKTPRAPSPG